MKNYTLHLWFPQAINLLDRMIVAFNKDGIVQIPEDMQTPLAFHMATEMQRGSTNQSYDYGKACQHVISFLVVYTRSNKDNWEGPCKNRLVGMAAQFIGEMRHAVKTAVAPAVFN